MKRRYNFPAVILVVGWFATLDGDQLFGADDIQTAGDVLQLVLPVTAGALTLAHLDGQGTLELGESLVVTMGATYALKYGKSPSPDSRFLIRLSYS